MITKRAQSAYNKAHPDQPLPAITLHALRHGWATLALEAGVPMKVVQDRLNHVSERITADIYTQVRAPLQSDATDRVAGMILPFQACEVTADRLDRAGSACQASPVRPRIWQSFTMPMQSGAADRVAARLLHRD